MTANTDDPTTGQISEAERDLAPMPPDPDGTGTACPVQFAPPSDVCLMTGSSPAPQPHTQPCSVSANQMSSAS